MREMPRGRPIAVRFKAEELLVLDTRAEERGCTRSELLRRLAVEGVQTPPAQNLTEPDLVALLEEQAGRGNVRAIELLLKRFAKVEKPAEPFEDFDELASRRAS
jgi:hypothetical protein